MVSLETIVLTVFHQAKHISIRAKVDSLLFISLTECISCLPRIQTFFDNLYTVFINETSQDVGARQCRYVYEMVRDWNGLAFSESVFKLTYSTTVQNSGGALPQTLSLLNQTLRYVGLRADVYGNPWFCVHSEIR